MARKRFRLPGFSQSLNASDKDFLFPDSIVNSAFPDRRDVLRVDIELPDGTDQFTLLVHHAKSRFGGRAKTNARRVDASKRIIDYLRVNAGDENIVLVCDCNDTPDDQSVNILETGDPEAKAEMEDRRGPFLFNLTEPVFAEGHVSYGRNSTHIVGQRINTLDMDARRRNYSKRASDMATGDQLFDQILVSPKIMPAYQADSVGVFDRKVAVRGNRNNRASDHLPVYADFVFSSSTSREQPSSNEVPNTP